MKKINVGIIGCGTVAEQYHLVALRRVPTMHVSALVDANLERTLKLKELFFPSQPIRVTTNYHEILEKDIDAILILTPPYLHEEMAINAIKAGKHVFCEKPFTLTIEEAESILHALQKKKVRLMVGFNFRFITHFTKTKKFLEKKTIGRLIRANTTFYSNIKRRPSVSKFHIRKDKGGGALFEMGCHHIDLLRWIMGEIRSVQAFVENFDPSIPVDDNASVFLEFVNGTRGFVNISWSAPYQHKVEISGQEGIITADLSKPYIELYLNGRSIFKQGTLNIPVKATLDSYTLELTDFANSILHDREPSINAEDGLRALEIVLACYESAGKGQRITI